MILVSESLSEHPEDILTELNRQDVRHLVFVDEKEELDNQLLGTLGCFGVTFQRWQFPPTTVQQERLARARRNVLLVGPKATCELLLRQLGDD